MVYGKAPVEMRESSETAFSERVRGALRAHAASASHAARISDSARASLARVTRYSASSARSSRPNVQRVSPLRIPSSTV